MADKLLNVVRNTRRRSQLKGVFLSILIFKS